MKFRQASHHCKRVVEAPKLAYTNKGKESTTSRNLGIRTFSKLQIVFLAKVNLYPLFNHSEELSSGFDKAKLFPGNCTKKANLDDLNIFLCAFYSRTYVRLYKISPTPNLVKKAKNNL